jgi:hypothetical protein
MALGIGGVTLGSVSTASAQPVYVGPRYYAPGLPPGEVMRIVQRAGFVPLSAPMRRGPNYVVIATGRTGQVRVVVNAFAGDIVRVNPVIAMRPFGPPVSAYSTLPPGYQPMPPSAAYPPPPSVAAPPPPPSGSAAVPPPALTRSAPAVTGSEPTVTSRANTGPATGGTLPAPSRGFGNPKLANAEPSGTIASIASKLDSKVEKTPLPRPRPSVASNNVPAAAISAPPTTASVPAPVSSFRRRSAPAVAPGDLPPDTDAAPVVKPAAPAMVPVAPLD